MEENNVTFRDILKVGNYRKMIISDFINRFGDSIDAIAVTWLVYQVTHEAFWSALVFFLNTFPNVAVQPFAGAYVERLNKKRVVVVTNFLRALVIACFILLYRFNMVNAWVLALTTLIITTIESFNQPASSAFYIEVVKKEDMTASVSLGKILSSAATLIGTGVAGVIIAVGGVGLAMSIDVLTFVVAALLIVLVKYKAESDSENAASQDSPQEEGYFALLKDGFKYVLKREAIRNFCLLAVALNFMLVPINALQAPIVSEIFKMGEALLSVAGVCASIGGIVGAALLPFAAKKLSPFAITNWGIAILGFGVLEIAMGSFFGGNVIAGFIIAGSSFFMMVAAATLMGSVIGVQFMKSVDKSYMARASAVFGAVATAAMPIGSLLVSALVAKISTRTILFFSAAFALVVLLVCIITKPVLSSEE